MGISDAQLMALFTTIARGDDAAALRKLDGAPALATAALRVGASRETAKSFFFDEIRHGVYAGDTALHVAAAAFSTSVVERLLVLGASTRTKNRRGAEPLHYAVDGNPGEAAWNPEAQTQVIARLLAAGADPNAADKNGSAPLHRAVRNRCAGAVRALLDGGADLRRANKSGSTPRDLAMQTTGRGGSGSIEAKEQRRQIVGLLDTHR